MVPPYPLLISNKGHIGGILYLPTGNAYFVRPTDGDRQ
jgi:hypothetical protein